MCMYLYIYIYIYIHTYMYRVPRCAAGLGVSQREPARNLCPNSPEAPGCTANLRILRFWIQRV